MLTAVMTSTSYMNPLQAVEPNLSELEPTIAELEPNLSELESTTDISETSENGIKIVDQAIYLRNDPVLQFVYLPNQFVIESFATNLENDEFAPADYINIWTKEDYVILKNAGDEIGDFLPRLKITIKNNPERLSLEDWVLAQPKEVLPVDRTSIERRSIGGEEGLSFVSTDRLLPYQNTIVKDATGDKVIMISYGTFRGEAAASSNALYLFAFEQLEGTLELADALTTSNTELADPLPQ
ncbi:hypothetical protein [cf. Phormidesmis sp. LEGE 11477]|uniref:hypothetical protein n=1 Tax=cf. Phormidesmis sp. LEGE 11477 TaxID=1828680 RepID=UPI0018811A8E|nr:hypothetical protein [cf. Phormidesmis sp. LEGE 11477]MBE9060504.1 hypothetical protein [cf. Phormidesmis sp. LEGE 11477]